MTESPAAVSGDAADDGSAGALLRAARTRQGMHIAMLAASIKVPQVKLEALEAGRFEELPDATFTRALAQSICRVLKIDPAPVLARLPGAAATALEKVDGGLNMPFRERPGRIDPTDWSPSGKAMALVVVVLLAAAAALWLQPVKAPLWQELPAPAASAPPVAAPPGGAASASAEPASAAVATAQPAAGESAATESSAVWPASSVLALGGPAPAAVAPAPPAMPRGNALGLRASQACWVQVSDNQGRVLLSRQLGAGEAVELDGEPPYKLRVGNAGGIEVRFRGALVDLASIARSNVATLTLP
jgi:cytoskeleton protein RodZ